MLHLSLMSHVLHILVPHTLVLHTLVLTHLHTARALLGAGLQPLDHVMKEQPVRAHLCMRSDVEKHDELISNAKREQELPGRVNIRTCVHHSVYLCSQ